MSSQLVGTGGGVPLEPHLPPGFEDTFGPFPDSNKFPSGAFLAWGAAVGDWIRNLGLFAEAGRKLPGGESAPAWASDQQIAKANATLDKYNVPHPKYFRFNFRAEDPKATGEWQALIPLGAATRGLSLNAGWYQCHASLVVFSPGLAAANWQEACLQVGFDPTAGDRSKRHPWVRDWPDAEPEGASRVDNSTAMSKQQKTWLTAKQVTKLGLAVLRRELATKVKAPRPRGGQGKV